MQQEIVVDKKTTITRTTRTVEEQPVIDAEAEAKAKRSAAAKKAAATRKAAEARKAEEAKQKAEAKPETAKKPFNWLWVIIPLAILILLGCVLLMWGAVFSFRFNAPAPAPVAQPTTIVLVQPTRTPFAPTPVVVQPTVVPQPTAVPTAILAPTAVPNIVQPTVVPTAVPPAATVAPAAATAATVQNSGTFTFVAPSSDLDSMPKTSIEQATLNTWFHRVFNTSLFTAANNWGGADSWFVSLALGPNSGGNWTSMGNPGQIVYRGTSTHIQWDLGVLTTGQWKSQFMGDGNLPAAINVRIAPNSIVTVVTASGKTVTQATSDMGDITIILPDSGIVTISVDYSTAAPTHESLVWWGPYDRSASINTVDAR